MKALLTGFVLVALVASGVLLGGLRLAYALPAYVVLAVAAILICFRKSPRELPRQVLPCLLASGVFFGYILLRAVLSPVEYLARADLCMVLGALMLYLLVALHITSAKHRMALVACLLLFGVVHSVVGAIQFSKGNEFMPFELLKRGLYGVRASGFYSCPNHFAGFLEVVSLMSLSIACWSRWRLWSRLVIGYFAVVCFGGLAISGSRGGYLSTILGLLVLVFLSILVLRKQNRVLFWRMVMGNLVLIGILAFSAERMISRSYFLKDRSANVVNTENIRPQLWKSGWEQFKLSPVWGTGSRTFLYYGRQLRADRVTQDPVYLHNDYLQLLAEYGVAGMLGFLLFLAAHLRSGIHTFAALVAKRTTISVLGSNSIALNIGALASVATYVAHSFVDFNLHIPANTLLIAFVFGVLTGTGSSRVAHASEAVPSSPRLVWLLRLSLPALALWMAIAGLPNLRAEYFAERARLALIDFQHPECERYADQGLRLTSRNPYLYYYKGEAQAGMAETAPDPAATARLHEQSIDHFRKALDLFPQEQNFVLSLGWALDALGRYEESEPVFQRAMELDPKSGQVKFYYAAHLHLRGDRDAARTFYKKAQEAGSQSAIYGLQRLDDEDKPATRIEKAASDATAD